MRIFEQNFVSRPYLSAVKTFKNRAESS